MSPVAVSADRRFHRAHVKPARKRGRLRTVYRPILKAAAAAAIVLFAIYRGNAMLADAPILKIDRIVVRGNHRLPNGDVLAQLNGLRGENLLFADLAGWRDRLLQSPWVQDASFRRSLPSTVEVVVSEREPIAIGRVKNRLFLVDERGAVIDEFGPQYADFDLPIVDGLSGATGTPVDADDPRGELAARVIVSLRAKPAIAKRLSQVDVSNAHNAAVILNGDPAVIYVGEDRFLPRIESYLELSDALRERVAEIDYVDLRFDDRIYVRPAAKAARPVAFAGGPDAGKASRTTLNKR